MCTKLCLRFEIKEYLFSTFIGKIQSINRVCIFYPTAVLFVQEVYFENRLTGEA